MSDSINTLVEEIVTKAAPRLVEQVVAEVSALIKSDLIFCYTEKEAAEKLCMSERALRQIRARKEIEFSYSILPTANARGTDSGGRVTYQPRHLQEYLDRNQRKRFFGGLKAA